MQLQNDVSEIKMSIVEYHSRQMRLVENSVANGSAGWLPTGISRGYATLVDATGREHTILLDQCRYFDVCIHNIGMCVDETQQMILATRCHALHHPLRWYIERK